MRQKASNSVLFKHIAEEIQPQKLLLHDPLGRLLFKLSPKTSLPIIGIALGMHVLITFGGGGAISIIYARHGVQFLSLFDKTELLFVGIGTFVFIPLLWLFYTWQPRGISDALARLDENGVMGDFSGSLSLRTNIIPRKLLYSRINFMISLVAPFTGLVVFLKDVFSPANPLRSELTPWILVNPIYFWAIWLPHLFVNLYIVTWIVVRQAIATVLFTRMFLYFKIRPKLFHPDRCNGFASIGDYAIYTAFMAVLFGFWVSVLTLYPILFGYTVNLRTEHITMWMLYVIAVPSLLIPPVMQAHRSMAKHKSDTLESLAQQIRGLLLERDAEKILVSRDLLLELERRYEVIEKEYRTWPFRPLSIKGLGVSAVIPILSTGISYFVDLYTRR